MGWSFLNTISTYKEMAEYLLSDTKNNILAKALVGSHFYIAYERLDENQQRQVTICLFLMQISQGECGYKAIGESAGPTHYTCPERILKLSTDTSVYAVEWRAKCREMARRKKEWPQFVAKLTFDQPVKTHDGNELRFRGILNKKYIACFNTEKQKVFRYDFEWFDF